MVLVRQASRYSSYGILVVKGELLLARKRAGPYAGLWGLPGGAIEFGETPEQALQREVLEEAALSVVGLTLLGCATSNGSYKVGADRVAYHHVGMFFRIRSAMAQPECIPEEEVRWVKPGRLQAAELTPFAREAFQRWLTFGVGQ